MIEQNKGDVQIIFDSSRFWSSRMVDFKVNWLMTKQIGEAEVGGQEAGLLGCTYPAAGAL